MLATAPKGEKEGTVRLTTLKRSRASSKRDAENAREIVDQFWKNPALQEGERELVFQKAVRSRQLNVLEGVGRRGADRAWDVAFRGRKGYFWSAKKGVEKDATYGLCPSESLGNFEKRRTGDSKSGIFWGKVFWTNERPLDLPAIGRGRRSLKR